MDDIEKKAFSDLVAKVDALTKVIDDLKPKQDTENIPDPRDISIERGKAFLNSYLEKDIPKEKRDTYSFTDLLVAADLKLARPTNQLNPAPPIEKTDAVKDNRPEWLIPTVVSR